MARNWMHWVPTNARCGDASSSWPTSRPTESEALSAATPDQKASCAEPEALHEVLCRFQPCQLRSAIRSMYCCMASSCEVPLRLFQASHLALATISLKPGFFSVLSPLLPCL